MNIISKNHQEFSKSLNNPRVLSNPEEFLGPNFKAVLNFWNIFEELSEDQWITVERRYWDFQDNQPSEWCKARDEVFKASKETIGWEFAGNAAWAAQDVYNWAAGKFLGWAAYYTTRELIGMHKLFEQNKPLTFFQMFLEVL